MIQDLIEALQLIAAGPRPDGTWNRDREACRQLAEGTLAKTLAEAQILSLRGRPWPPADSVTPDTRMFDPLERA